MSNVATQFKPGCQAQALRKVHNGGRPPSQITSIRQELEDNPRRTRQLLDHLYNLALTHESGKVQLSATIDYLDRVGFRAPKESTLTISGMIAVGTPEDYRRAAMLLNRDREQEANLLRPGTPPATDALTPGNGQEPLVAAEIIESIITEVRDNADNDNKDV